MSRSVEEWIGKTDDSVIPPRVRLRVWQRSIGHCEECGRKIMVGEKWDVDHRNPLILGGEHRENNLRIICIWCHRGKTRTEVDIKSKNYRVASKHIGIKRRKGRPLAGSRNSPFKKKISGEVVLRNK